MNIEKGVIPRFASITILGFIVLFSFAFTSPILSLFALSVNTPDFLLAWIFLVSSAIQIFIRPIFGTLGDNYGRLKLVPIAVYLYVIANYIWYITTDPTGIFIGQVILSIAASMFWTSVMAHIPEIVKTKRLGLALGIAWTITDAAFVISPTLGGYIAETYSYRFAFLVDASFTFFAGTVFLLLLFYFERKYNSKTSLSENKKSIKDALRDLIKGLKVIMGSTRIRASLISVFMVGMAVGLFSTFYPILVKLRGYTETEIGLTLSSRSVAFMSLRIPGGTLSDRVNKVYILIFTTTLLAIVLFFLPLCNTLYEFAIWMLLSGVATGIFLPTGQSLVLENVDESQKGLAMGVWGSFFQLSRSFGFLLMSIIIIISTVEMIFFVFSGITFIGAALLVISAIKEKGVI